MGSCAIGKNTPTRTKIFQLPPDDICDHDPADPNYLDFQANLSHVRIQNLTPSLNNTLLSLEFKIPGIITINCPALMVTQGILKWSTNVSFSFSNNQHEIRANYLFVQVNDKSGKMITELKINLYRIMCGPFHHDIYIRKNEKMHGRLIFDLKIEQLVEINLQSQQAQIEFSQEYPGEKFNFVLQSQKRRQDNGFSAFGPIDKRKNSFKTIPSYCKQIPLLKKDNFRQISIHDEAPSPTYRLRRTAANLIKTSATSTLNWSKSEKLQMPGLRLKLKATQIYSSSFGFKLFKYVQNTNNLVEFGYYILTLSQLLSYQPQARKSQSQVQKRQIEIQKKLLKNGKNIGKCMLKLSLQSRSFIKQMPSHTQTEDGIINIKFYQSYIGKEASMKDQKFSQLQQTYKKIVQTTKEKTIASTFIERGKLDKELNKNLKLLSNNLTKSIKNSYSYHSEQFSDKMHSKQLILINLLKVLSCIIEQQNMEMGETCWKIVIQIMKRGELMLRYWGFNEKQEKQIESGNESGEIKKKMELGFELWKIMNQLLEQSLQIEINCRDQNKYSQIFKAYCYFRVPLFRQKILQVIQQMDKKIEEQLLIENKMESSEGSQAAKKKYFMKQIDWAGGFYRILNLKATKASALNENLSKFLDTHHWFEKLRLRDQTFFNFIRFLMAKLAGIRVLNKTPNVYYFIGYQIIASSYIQSLKERKIHEYSSSMILAGLSLIQNQYLFPIILTIIYEKTNLYDQTSVLRMLGIVSHFLDTVFRKGKIVNFPYQYFMQNLKTILDNVDCSISVSQTLNLLYNFYNNFEENFRYELSVYFLGSCFWKFFYHWSYSVRRTYFHIILLRIAQDYKLIKTTDIKDRIDDILVIVQNFEEKGKKRMSEKLIKNVTIQKAFYQQMKQKLIRKSLKKQDQRLISLGKNNQNCEEQLTFSSIVKIVPKKSQKIIIPASRRRSTLKIDNSQNQRGPRTTTQVLQKNSRVRTENDIQNEEAFDDKQNVFGGLQERPDGYSSQSTQYDIYDLTKLRLEQRPSYKASFHEHIFTYGCFTQQQLCLAIPPEQLHKTLQYCILAAKEFKEIIRLLDEHVREKEVLPEVELGVKVSYDQKEILPSSFDLSLVA